MLSVDIFRDVTFTIEGGEYIAIGGRNGCGKTTITRLLVGLEKASDGRMYYNGTDITSMPPSKRGQFIGYVFQQPDRQNVQTNSSHRGCFRSWITRSH